MPDTTEQGGGVPVLANRKKPKSCRRSRNSLSLYLGNKSRGMFACLWPNDASKHWTQEDLENAERSPQQKTMLIYRGRVKELRSGCRAASFWRPSQRELGPY